MISGQEDKKHIKKSRTNENYTALPAFIILAPLLIPVLTITNLVNQAWLCKYDPFRIYLGMKRSQVESIYGKPYFIIKQSGHEIHAYGPSMTIYKNGKLRYLGSNKKFWVAVMYENDVAVQILSHDLFHDMEIAKVENER